MKTLRTIFPLLVLAAGIYVGVQVVPPYVHEYQFEDALESIARFAATDERANEETIREKVVKQAADNSIPVGADDIHVVRVGDGYAIWTEYSVHLNLPVHPVDLTFKPATKNKPQVQ